MNDIFRSAQLNLFLKPYEIIVTSENSGILGINLFIQFRIRIKFNINGWVIEIFGKIKIIFYLIF